MPTASAPTSTATADLEVDHDETDEVEEVEEELLVEEISIDGMCGVY